MVQTVSSIAHFVVISLLKWNVKFLPQNRLTHVSAFLRVLVLKCSVSGGFYIAGIFFLSNIYLRILFH